MLFDIQEQWVWRVFLKLEKSGDLWKNPEKWSACIVKRIIKTYLLY